MCGAKPKHPFLSSSGFRATFLPNNVQGRRDWIRKNVRSNKGIG